MGKLILVAEDEAAMSAILVKKFRSLGYEVVLAEDGDSCLRRIRMDKPDIIIMDIVMPKRNGLDVLRTIRADGVITPVIILSNLDNDKDKESVKSLKVSKYLVKSDVSIKSIMANVFSILEPKDSTKNSAV